MSLLDDLKTYARLSWGLPGFLRHITTLEEARAIVRQRVAAREQSFLRLLERGAFGHPGSPYLALLKLAGCEVGDIRDMVRTRGLEETLLALREAGVYVTFEEFKGRTPIIRGGHVIPVRAQDFDNPHLRHYYEAESGGTTGPGTRIPVELDQLAAQVPLLMLAYDTHGVLGVPTAIWRGILPDITGVGGILRGARMGNVPWKWFTPVTPKDSRQPLRYALATHHIILMGRLLGTPLPRPEPVRLDQAAVVARWAEKTVKARGACLIRCHVSMALRVCLAAREEGLSLAGATFMGGGEPPTPAKVRGIMRAGARWVPSYVVSEAGHVGMGCGQPVDGNDVHLFKDALALIQYPRLVPGTEITVNAFCFTTLLPTAPKLMLNVESDDYGVIEHRSCGCPLETYGFTEHVRHVRSFRKLTGEGVTLVGNDMVRILEEALPERFGGSPLDYQLMEIEDDQGFTRLELLVSPRVEIPDETAVINMVLESLAHGTQALWRQARILRVRRAEPVWTARGKLMPLHLAESNRRR